MDPLSLLSIGGSLLSNIFGSNSAADAQAKASSQALAYQRENQAYINSLMQPAISAGNTARDQQMALLGLGGDQAGAMAAYRGAPGYQGGLRAGQNAINQGAANAGLMRSSGNIGDLGNFSSDYDGRAFGSYYDRLGGMTGGANQATSSLAGYSAQGANNMGNIATTAGNNAASGYIRNANSVTGAGQNLLDLYYRG